jgi:hypothetical protein
MIVSPFRIPLFLLSMELDCCPLLASCSVLSMSACTILCSYFRSVPNIKKNILTRLDELFVLNFTFFVCAQSCVCLLSVLTTARNDYLYLACYVVLYGSLNIGFGIAVGLSFARVLIMAVRISGVVHIFRSL